MRNRFIFNVVGLLLWVPVLACTAGEAGTITLVTGQGKQTHANGYTQID